MSKDAVYVSLDIETTGQCPGQHAMIQLGAVPIIRGIVHEDLAFGRWLLIHGGETWDPETLAWAKQNYTYEAHYNASQQLPEIVMGEFAYWLGTLPGKPIAAAWPATFDFGFVNYYCHRYLHKNPLGFAALDIRSYVAGLYHLDDYYGKPEEDIWALAGVDSDDHKHDAVEDATRQAKVLAAAFQRAKEMQ